MKAIFNPIAIFGTLHDVFKPFLPHPRETPVLIPVRVITIYK